MVRIPASRSRVTLAFVALLTWACQDAVRGEPFPADAATLVETGPGPDAVTDGHDPGDTGLDGGREQDGPPPDGESDATDATDATIEAGPAELVAAVSSEIAVDDTYVYALQDQDLVRIPKAGGAPIVIATVSPGRYPFATDGAYVFVIDQLTIHRLPRTGGGLLDLAPQGGVAGHVGVTLDAQHVYFKGLNDRLYRLPKDGAAQSELLHDPDTYDWPTLIAVTNTYLYWAYYEVLGQKYSVARQAFGTTTPEIVGSGQEIFAMVALANRLVWLDRELALRTLVGDSNQPVELVSAAIGAQHFDAPILCADDTHAYWASHSEGAVYRVPLVGGPHQEIARGYDFPLDPASTTENTIWHERRRVATDASYVYWSDASGIYRQPK